MSGLSQSQLEVQKRLNTDFVFACKFFPFMIKTKDGQIVPLHLNKAQIYVNSLLDKQLTETGKVRAIVLKGRQQGMSTMIGARFFWKTITQFGKGTFILSHEASTTDKLFRMVKRYYDNLTETIRPETQTSNRKELIFNKLQSEYAVGTAGNENIGRGGTYQMMHGSEVAFWNNTNEIRTGIMQAVPDMPNTEIILESTANGIGNMFHTMSMDAVAGKGEYRMIFVPWYWQSEYQKPVRGELRPDEEEQMLVRLYKMTPEQLQWRRDKIVELGSVGLFMQEYPNNVNEAFQVTGNNLISGEDVSRARKYKVDINNSPLVIGVDPARKGDRTIIAYRKGRDFFRYDQYDSMDSMQLAGILARVIQTMSPQKVFIDVGMGYGTLDRLRELGFGDVVTGIHFGSEAMQSENFINKRVEMWCELRDWLRGDVSIPDDDDVHADLCCVPDVILTSSGKQKLMDKSKIKEDFGRSPDIGDALALTFAFPVNDRLESNRDLRPSYAKVKGFSIINSLKNRGL